MVLSVAVRRRSTSSSRSRSGRRAGNNPWGARTLEWMISSPAPYYNFRKIPIVLDRPYDFNQPLPYRNLDEEQDPYPLPSEAVLARPVNAVLRPERSAWQLRSPRPCGATRSNRGRGALSRRRPGLRARRATSGSFGFVLFLLADCILFSSFVFAYLYLRSAAPVWPPIGERPPDRAARRRLRRDELDRAVRLGRDDALRARRTGSASSGPAFNAWLVGDDRARHLLPARPVSRVLDGADELARQRLRRLVLHLDRAARLPRLCAASVS